MDVIKGSIVVLFLAALIILKSVPSSKYILYLTKNKINLLIFSTKQTIKV